MRPDHATVPLSVTWFPVTDLLLQCRAEEMLTSHGRSTPRPVGWRKIGHRIEKKNQQEKDAGHNVSRTAMAGGRSETRSEARSPQCAICG